MKKKIGKKIIIAGVVRNGGARLRCRIEQLADAFKCFEETTWIIVESDSNDETVMQLNMLKKVMPNFKAFSLGNLTERINLRTERIAYCRNIYLEEIFSKCIYEKSDLLAVCDLDGVNDLLTEEKIKTSFERDDWDACFANQEYAYYDIWALRAENWNMVDCWESAKFLQGKGIAQPYAELFSIYSKMVEIKKEEPWIQVQSAFGGLGLYKINKIRNARYRGVSDQGKEICEHVKFNQDIHFRNGNLYINPRLINCGLNDHTTKIVKILRQFRT